MSDSKNASIEDIWIPTICYTCNKGPCMTRIHRVNGVVVNVEGNIDSPEFRELSRNKGVVCAKPFGNIQKLYNPYRIKGPLKRTNPEKGRGIDPKWVEITWDEALNTIAEKIAKIREDDPRKICAIKPGRKPSINGTWDCFLKALGPIDTLGSGGAVHCRMIDHLFGMATHGAYMCGVDYDYCNYLLALGLNRFASGGACEGRMMADAKARGLKMVAVDPVLTVTGAKADEWIPIKPCTDTAFLLAIIHVILHEIGIYDIPFLKHLTNSPFLVGPDGYFLCDTMELKPLIWDPSDQKAKAYDDNSIKDFALEGHYTVDGKVGKPAFQMLKDHIYQYTPEWATAITDIPPEKIRQIARELVDHARIGSTIQIDGVTLPYRPVATNTGRGVSGSIRSYHAFLADHVINILLGTLETVGGHKGGSNQPGGAWLTKGYQGAHSTIKKSHDGMVAMKTFDFAWPPTRSDLKNTLFPYMAVTEACPHHVSYINLSHPPEGLPLPPAPELAIAFRVNPIVSLGDPKLVGDVIKKIPFLVVISYIENEMTELADIVLPDHTDLERYDIGVQIRAQGRKYTGVILRQPVVEPQHNTMDISDILTEISERAGILAQYNQAINEGLGMGLSGHYQLQLNKKYPWVEILSRQIQSMTEGKYDLTWFKQHGAWLVPTGVEKQYDVHIEMTSKKIRYPLPYMEHVKKTGEVLKKNLAAVGMDWWPTEEYVPLPTFFPSVLENVPKEYDFYVTRCNVLQFYRGTNIEIPWLLESAEHVMGQGKIVMNAAVAQAKGIREGDEIWVETPNSKIRGRVKLYQGIRPDTIQIPGQFGHWATPEMRERQWTALSLLLPIQYDWTDPLTGSMQTQVVKAKVYKA